MKKIKVLQCDYPYSSWSLNNEDGKWDISCSLEERNTIPHTEYISHDQVSIEKIQIEKNKSSLAFDLLCKEYSKKVTEAMIQGNKVLCESGYCVYAPAILGGIQKAFDSKKEIGVVWIDAHSDNVVLENTKRKKVTFVSIPFSTMLGKTMHKWRVKSCNLMYPIKEENVVITDARCASLEEVENLNSWNVQWINERDFENDDYWKEKIMSLVARVDVIYVMIDADILLHMFIPGYFRQEPGGHTIEMLLNRLDVLLNLEKTKVISTFCFDFDKKENKEIDIKTQKQIIEYILSHWK